MKRSGGISFSLSSKRRCDPLNNTLKSKSGALCFTAADDDEESLQYCNEIPPFITKSMAIEDTPSICLRLKLEGNTLAENSRFWEAISKFKSAIQLQSESPETNKDYTMISVLHELCSQCYSELGELYPSVESAEQAVKYNSSCHIAHQTLARAQTNIGELYLAQRNIQRCLHLNPSNTDAWCDLEHIRSLTVKLELSSWSSLPIETRPGIVCQR